VFERLREGGFKIKLEKCNFLVEEVKNLGHTVTKDGVKPDIRKEDCIKTLPTPLTADQLQSFLGLPAYYRRFIANFAEIASGLNKLTQKQEVFKWTDEHNKRT
jgi:hypothetical protein